MSTITKKQQTKIAKYLSTHVIPRGLGTEESACSIAAINLALSGELTDTIPACMSEVTGKWIITVQDSMPSDMRNSDEWKRLLPMAAGTGRGKEAERLAIIMDWMWVDVLPSIQSVADANGFGGEWRLMCKERTKTAAAAARAARAATVRAARAAATRAARAAARAATRAARAAARAATARAAAAAAAATAAEAAWAARAAAAAAEAAEAAAAAEAARAAATARAEATAWAARAAARAARARAEATAWDIFNPSCLLKKLIEA